MNPVIAVIICDRLLSQPLIQACMALLIADSAPVQRDRCLLQGEVFRRKRRFSIGYGFGPLAMDRIAAIARASNNAA